jgi:hypothetical protein
MTKGRVAYIRVSGDDQVEKSTPESQREELRRMGDRSGLSCLGVYEDLAVSGVSVRLGDRPGWRALERRLEQGGVSEIHCVDVTRLTREDGFSDLDRLHKLMKRHDVVLVTATEGRFTVHEYFDLTKLAFVGLGGGGEAKRNRGRFDVGKKRVLGLRPIGGPPPLGLRWSRQDGWTIDARWAPVIRRIYVLCVEGRSLLEISEILHQDGTPPPGAERWSASWLARLLHRREYRGERRQTYLGESAICPVPPIVDTELWEAVQVALRSRRNLPQRRNDVAFLARLLLVCGTCGARLWAQPAWGTSPGRYFCKKCSSSGVGSPYWRRDEVDAALWSSVSAALLNADGLLEAAARESAGPDETPGHAELADRARADLAGIERRRDAVRRRATSGLISDEEADADLARLSEQRRSAEARVRAADNSRRAAEQFAAQRVSITQRVGELRGRIANADAATRREIVEAVVPPGVGEIRLHRSGRMEVRGVLPVVVELSPDSPAP